MAIGPPPPKGILRLPFSTLKAASPALLHPSSRHGVVPLTLEEFTYKFVNTLDPEAAAAAYERFHVPETGRILFEGGLANFRMHGPTELDYAREGRAPLLIVGNEKDHTIPASVSHANWKKHRASASVTDYLEFEGRPHLAMGTEGWEEIAEAIDGWLDRVAADAPVSAA